MRKKIRSYLILSSLLCLAAIGIQAQTTARDINARTAEWQNVLAKASESAVLEDGKIQSMRLNLPNDPERVLSFEHSKDGRSFTILEDGRRTHVVLDDQRRISAITYPDGKKAAFEWVQGPNGFWVPSSIKVDGREMCKSKSNNNGIVEEGGCYDLCQNAAAATVIAVGVCVVSGPASVSCWSSTAAAAYATYLCYRCANPQVETPPEN
jgi:hypothetical protein